MFELKRKSIPRSEWIVEAQRLPVGQSRRVYHGSESRANMVVRNTVEGWSCHCFECNAGGFQAKELVRFSSIPSAQVVPPSSDPGTLIPIYDLSSSELKPILGHLQSKGVSPTILMWANPCLSRKDKRLVFHTEEGMVGRDLTGTHPAKWHTYRMRMHFMRGGVYPFSDGRPVAVTEDFYSASKITYYTDGAVLGVACLGTLASKTLTACLLNCPEVYLCFDGDEYGKRAAIKYERLLNLLGIQNSQRLPPAGFDPKDLSPEQICNLLGVMKHGTKSC